MGMLSASVRRSRHPDTCPRDICDEVSDLRRALIKAVERYTVSRAFPLTAPDARLVGAGRRDEWQLSPTDHLTVTDVDRVARGPPLRLAVWPVNTTDVEVPRESFTTRVIV